MVNQKILISIIILIILLYFVFKKFNGIFSTKSNPKKFIGYYETWDPFFPDSYDGPQCKWDDCLSFWGKNGSETGGSSVETFFKNGIKPYTMINWSFLTLVQSPDLSGTIPQSWDGNIYYNKKNVLEDPTVLPILKKFYKLTLKEGKDFTIAFGGWSDVVKFENIEEAERAGRKMVEIVQNIGPYCGIDLDYEHLASPAWKSSPSSMVLLAKLMNAIKKEDPGRYLSYTTRSNGIYNDNSKPYGNPVINFVSDNEAQIVLNALDNINIIDNVNIIVDDSDAMVEGEIKSTIFDYNAIIDNFISGGVPKEKIVIGIKTGKQVEGSTWNGFNTHVNCVAITKNRDIGGMLVWSINPTSDFCGQGSQDPTCQEDPEKRKKQHEYASIITTIVTDYVRDCLLLDKNCTTGTPLCTSSF